ncbi:uncharacterized protein [Drosophila tropicalis]|uniref:uncharacterized protein n=1 Tax=Drosophila tropicalis TaxID=46794 RepID=UPI0035AC2262
MYSFIDEDENDNDHDDDGNENYDYDDLDVWSLVSIRNKKLRPHEKAMFMFNFIQLNLNHCEAAHELLKQRVRETRSDVAIISEPFRRMSAENWICSNSGKAVLWACGNPNVQLRSRLAGGHFVRALINGKWIYSCYFPPSLDYLDFCESLDELAADARAHIPFVIAGDFNAWAQEWGSSITNARGRAVLESLASLDVALLNCGSRNTFNSAGRGSIIDLTFVSNSLARFAAWRLDDNYTASDHEAIIFSFGQAARPQQTRTQAVELPYKADTLNTQAFTTAIYDATLAAGSDVASSYRPICLIDTVGKVLEGLINTRLNELISRSNGLSENQFGFRKARSTIDAISKVVNIAANAIEGSRWKGGSKKYCLVVTIDVKNAFNTADWGCILSSVCRLKAPVYLQAIIRSYFEGRVLRFNTDEGCDSRHISAGVPQGSVLGPLLWNIMYDGILRIPLPPGCETIGYADDVALVIVAKDLATTEAFASCAIEKITNWLHSVGLSLAVHKTEAVLISSRKTVEVARILVEGSAIVSKRAIRYLGVWIDTRLCFREHLNHVHTKAASTGQALSRIIPIDLLADEDKAIAVAVSRGTPKKEASSEARIRSLVNWQRRWDASTKGRSRLLQIISAPVWA